MRKVTGSYRTYSISGKTAVLVPEFVVEDLPSPELMNESDLLTTSLPPVLLLQDSSFKT